VCQFGPSKYAPGLLKSSLCGMQTLRKCFDFVDKPDLTDVIQLKYATFRVIVPYCG